MKRKPSAAARDMTAAKAAAPKAAKTAGRTAAARGRTPFPRKNQPPTEAEFLARLPLPVGKRFETVRAFMRRQKDVREELFFYGPKTGWAFRYLRGSHSLATITLHDDRLVGIVALDAAAIGAVDFASLSDVTQEARRLAHGSPSLLWLDVPFEGRGASDFKLLLKEKLKGRPPPERLPPPPPTPPPPPQPARRT